MDCFVACAPRNDGELRAEDLMSLAPRFHRLAVNDLRRESAGRGIADLCDPAGAADDYSFAPGQYLTLRTTMDGEEVRRSYSICSGPDDGELRIAVKKVDGGAFSSWAADELKAGDELDVMTPTGRFGVAHAPDQARVYVGFAAGSGITPILSIVKGVLAREPQQPLLPVLRQPLDLGHAVPRSAGRAERPLHAAASRSSTSSRARSRTSRSCTAGSTAKRCACCCARWCRRRASITSSSAAPPA